MKMSEVQRLFMSEGVVADCHRLPSLIYCLVNDRTAKERAKLELSKLVKL